VLASCGGADNPIPNEPSTFAIGGTVSGLAGTVVLQNNGTDNLSLSADGPFTFASSLTDGASYNVTVLTQPDGEQCVVPNGTGVAHADVTNISVNCSQQAYSLNVTTTGDGAVQREPNQLLYAGGSQVRLTAVPKVGSAFSSWTGGLTGTQNPLTVTVNSDLSINATFVHGTFRLTVEKAGLAGGTITGTGINCGTDCTEEVGPISVVLTAVPEAGATFGSWTGCDQVSGNTCTVRMVSERTVTASFGFVQRPPRVGVPLTSSSGNYVVKVECQSSLCSTSIVVQEAGSAAFVNPTQTFFGNAPDPLEISITAKPPGMYCYRAAFTVPNWSDPACVTVSSPSTAVLRISNTSSYDIIDIQLNGVQKVGYPDGILAGQSADFIFTTGGTVALDLGNGFYNTDHSRNIWFTLRGNQTVVLGQTSTVTFSNPTIGQLLTGFTTSRDWDGQYFDDEANSFFARFRFTSLTGGWQLFDSNGPCFGGSSCSFTQIGQGSLRLLSWPRYSPIVTFDLGSGTKQASIAYPFGSFMYSNGPASWPIIEYVAH
jgi:hypothetical protein